MPAITCAQRQQQATAGNAAPAAAPPAAAPAAAPPAAAPAPAPAPPAAGPCAPPAASPAPAAPPPCEGGWRLLLSEVWDGPEAADLCALLASSRGMAAVVHSACAGRLHARLPPLGGTAPRRDPLCTQAELRAQWAADLVLLGRALARWLAKHAVLLASLEVDVRTQHDVYVAAALCCGDPAAVACLHGASEDGGGEPEPATADAIATATAAGSASEPPAARLPHLREFTLHLGRGAAHCTHARQHALLACVPAALSQLTRLRVLCGAYDSTLHTTLAGALARAPQLEVAEVDMGRLALQQQQFALDGAPRLRELTVRASAVPKTAPFVSLATLPSLTRLEFPCLGAHWRKHQLPAALRRLTVQHAADLLPLTALQQLTELRVESEYSHRKQPLGWPHAPGGPHPLQRLTQLHALRLCVTSHNTSAELLSHVTGLSQLTALELEVRSWQLLYGSQVAVWGDPFVEAVCAAMPALRRLALRHVGLSAQQHARLEAHALERGFEAVRLQDRGTDVQHG